MGGKNTSQQQNNMMPGTWILVSFYLISLPKPCIIFIDWVILRHFKQVEFNKGFEVKSWDSHTVYYTEDE